MKYFIMGYFVLNYDDLFDINKKAQHQLSFFVGVAGFELYL